MWTADIKERVEAIRNKADDDEAASSMERQLFIDFIKECTNTGSLILNNKARQVLKCLEIEFHRG